MKIPNMRKTSNEGNFQRRFVEWLEAKGAKTLRYVANGASKKGKPDVAVFYGPWWGWIEFKKSEDSDKRPGQQENVDWANERSYGAFVYPENETEIKIELSILFMKVDKCVKCQK